ASSTGAPRPLPTLPRTTLPVCPPNLDPTRANPDCAANPTAGSPDVVAKVNEMDQKIALGLLDRGDLYGFVGTYFTENVTGGDPTPLESSLVPSNGSFMVYALARNERETVAQLTGSATVLLADGSTETTPLVAMISDARP